MNILHMNIQTGTHAGLRFTSQVQLLPLKLVGGWQPKDGMQPPTIVYGVGVSRAELDAPFGYHLAGYAPAPQAGEIYPG